MTIESYFDRLFVINLDRRTDRWAHCQEQFKRYGLTKVERFSGYADVIDHHGKVNGNCGCSASHRALLEIIAYHQWPRVLILEDDFEIRFDDFDYRFARMISEVPPDWDMLYLGGHFAEKPQARVSRHVIRMGHMFTTSSYAVTHKLARKIAPYICGVGPIDSLYAQWHRSEKCYIFDPRLMVQYSSFSDLTERDSTNAPCMEDMTHSRMV